MPRKTLLLGGTRYAPPAIDAAYELGAKVVTCDYPPYNYVHALSDAYINTSIIDNEAVLATAKECKADGIMSFASAPGVVAASYAAEKLGLPFQGSYEDASILQDKERYRAFLRDNGFNCPELHICHSADEAMAEEDSIAHPVIAKPVDAAGPKGYSHVDEEQLWVEPGAKVEVFSAANHAFGSVFMRFDSQAELDGFRASSNDYMRVKVC